jgi:diacylglycerol kinase family enzyme
MALNSLAGMSGVTVMRASEVRIGEPSDAEAYIQIDGELAGQLPADLKIVPDALTVLLPETYGK